MKLVHFSATPITKVRSVKQQDSWPDGGPLGKPRGLWVSDEAGYGWKEWCKGQDFNQDRFEYAYEVELQPDASILYIRTPEELDAFTEKYGTAETVGGQPITWNHPGRPQFIYDIKWGEVAKEYQGIIITPYQWSRRLATESIWYNGWDCASGCIWDAAAVQSIKEVEGVAA